LDVLVEVGAQQALRDDRDLVEAAIRKGLQSGSAALFLDGLDETRELRHEVVRRLDTALTQVHEDVEVVLSTRDAAYADARTLGFASLRLLSPRNPEKTVRRILEEKANALSIREDDKASWTGDRAKWVEDALRTERGLGDTPLVPILLALLAAEREAGPLPTTRARVLSEIVDDVVRRWEVTARRRGTLRLGALEGEAASLGLLDAFECIADVLGRLEAPTHAEVVGPVAVMLGGERWQVPHGQAEATARDLLGFWDEMGVFAAGGSPPTVEARVRLFIEVGEARRVSKLPRDQQTPWVRDATGDPDRHEILVLAAGLSSAIVGDLIGVVRLSRSHSLALLAARAVREGATPSSERLVELVRVLTSELESLPSEAWEAAQALAELPVPGPMRGEIVEGIRNLPPPLRGLGVSSLLAWVGRGGSRS